MASPDRTCPQSLRTKFNTRRGTQIVHEYNLLKKLSSGATSTVYLADDLDPPEKWLRQHPQADLNTPCLVVIKDLHSDIQAIDPHQWSSIISEWMLHELVAHPNMVPILQFGVDSEDQSLFLVLPYYENARPLGDIMFSACSSRTISPGVELPGPLISFDLALRYLYQLADVLCAWHQKGVIHRDLKPDNVLIVPRVNVTDAMLIDMGVAKLIDGGRASFELKDRLSRLPGEILKDQPHLLVGTPKYMSPEQIRGSTHSLTTAVDSWSFAVLAYEMLTGFLPFSTVTQDLCAPPPSVMSLIHVVNEAIILPIELRLPKIPKNLQFVIQSCLQKEPSARPSMENIRSILSH